MSKSSAKKARRRPTRTEQRQQEAKARRLENRSHPSAVKKQTPAQRELACKVIRDHFRKISTRLSAQADIAGVLGHASTTGRLREEQVHNFLKSHLPRTMEVRSGIIMDSYGMRTTQQDCIIVDTRFPLIDVGSGVDGLILAESVLATIEIKSFLSGEELIKTLENNVVARQLRREGIQIYEKGGIQIQRRPAPILQYIFAFAGLEVSTLAQHVQTYAVQANDGGAAPDAVCVLGRGLLLRSSSMPVKTGGTITLPPISGARLTMRPLREDALYGFYRKLIDDIVPLRMANWELDAYYSEEELA